MPHANWNIFSGLPSSPQYNFELLCRGLVRAHYAQFGAFAALANQPGVEFHIRLERKCSLGAAKRWYGWQCKFFDDLPVGKALGTTRRKQIEKSLKMTKKHLPGLTDWVLWTKHTLTKPDQTWYCNLKKQYGFRLHLWDSSELESHLTGAGEGFRRTYFGDLALTSVELEQIHLESVAPIQHRYLSNVHQQIDAERAIEKLLGEPDAWTDLLDTADQLAKWNAALKPFYASLNATTRATAKETVQIAESTSQLLHDIHDAITAGDIEVLRQNLSVPPVALSESHLRLPSVLRSARSTASLIATNLVSRIRWAHSLLAAVDRNLGSPLVAIVADAGNGKTQLCAHITSPHPSRAAGILLHGGSLHSSHNLDTLAKNVTINGTQVSSMDALLAALNAAGQRESQRLPLAIDGLNEAQDPRRWKPLLASLVKKLRNYPYVLVICTLRSAFVSESISDDIPRFEIRGFGGDSTSAIRGYFHYYKIDHKDALLPLFLLRHPLTLRLFCEVTNPDREKWVGVEAIPASLSVILEKHLEQVAQRIIDLSSIHFRYYEQDIRSAVETIGRLLWESGSRHICETDLRKELNDHIRPWDRSIVRALQDEGVLVRNPDRDTGSISVTASFDSLAGYIIADTLSRTLGADGIKKWIKKHKIRDLISEGSSSSHPLAGDIFRELCALLPRRTHKLQLWQLLTGELRTKALVQASYLEPSYLDRDTVDELRKRAASSEIQLFQRLWSLRSSPNHPLNTIFLDSILRPMAVADRDMHWTEWVRQDDERLLRDCHDQIKYWAESDSRDEGDNLTALWLSWILTSTCRALRDFATKALYSYGRGSPRQLFELTLSALDINDAYVSERLLAASYGVALAHQRPDPTFEQHLGFYLRGLEDALLGAKAQHPTSHWLSRHYVGKTAQFTATHYPQALPKGFIRRGSIPFARGRNVSPIGKTHPNYEEAFRPVHMDFHNYTLGRLLPDRGNYDMTHKGHQNATAHICGTIWEHGWRKDGLGQIDSRISSYRSRMDRSEVERYGKKYSWIGFYTYAGQLCDSGKLSRREHLSDVDIDPSFPEPLHALPSILPDWSQSEPKDEKAWFTSGKITIPDELFYCQTLCNESGPWIAVDGYLQIRDELTERDVFALLQCLLVEKGSVDALSNLLNAKEYPGNHWLPQATQSYYTFAGEIPWVWPQGDEEDMPPMKPRMSKIESDVLGQSIITEILAHDFYWESYHSVTNDVGSARVPTPAFSKAFNLRSRPNSFCQECEDGSLASLTLKAPDGFNGGILYLREDLVRQYAKQRDFVWIAWGERLLFEHVHHPPKWMVDAAQKHKHLWRCVKKSTDVTT